MWMNVTPELYNQGNIWIIMDTHNSIMDLNNLIMDIHNSAMDMPIIVRMNNTIKYS